MKDDRLHDDDLALANAFRAVRETYDGAHEAPNLTLQRALFRTRTRERKRRVVRWVVLPVAAALFAEAHRLHFVDRDPVRALAAWDRYLAAAPSGRFVPEARYNRALALIRAGRELEAKRELEAFANGTYGGYRRDEARALLDAIDGDASRP